MSPRLDLAAEQGAVQPSRVVVIGAGADLDLSGLQAASLSIVQDMMPDAAVLADRGFPVTQVIEGAFDTGVVILPRSKTAARDMIARAVKVAPRVLVDGAKTDGIESILREVRRRTPVLGTVSKAHGKLFWFDAGADFSDWLADHAVLDGRWHVAPGVFSANGIDPGSAILTAHFPATLNGAVADLGAGWGYLSACMLKACPKITALHLVEAQGRALECARANVGDPRAEFHWADATQWAAVKGLDAVVMNPPFHTGRRADTDLGRAFIAAAARLLRPGGHLWMVANRHLAYEQELARHFATVQEVGGDNRYKILHATALPRKGR